MSPILPLDFYDDVISDCRPSVLKHIVPYSGANQYVEKGAIICFVHIPKTAGITFGTIASAVATTRGQRWHRIKGTIYDECFGAKRSNAWESIPASRPELERATYVTGHIPYGSLDDIGRPVVYVTLLRSPLSRSLSHLRHILRETRQAYSDQLFDELLESRALADNVQVRMVAGCVDRDVPCGEDMLERAKRNLEQFMIVGLTEQFELFLKLFAGVMHWPSVVYADRNKTDQSVQISAAKMRKLAMLNEYDVKLFEYAEKLARKKHDRVLECVRNGAPPTSPPGSTVMFCTARSMKTGPRVAVEVPVRQFQLAKQECEQREIQIIEL